jgi:xanthine dehydrogenase YagT iron-sulfur-binding subunit
VNTQSSTTDQAAAISPPGAIPVSLRINGQTYTFDIEPRVSLLDALREYLHLTGSKKGCNQGACGACTVLCDGNRVLSCLSLAVQYEGREITTVEGLANDGKLHPLQAAFIEYDGLQYAWPDLLRDRHDSGVSGWFAQRGHKRRCI